jgi:hypothetical protein
MTLIDEFVVSCFIVVFQFCKYSGENNNSSYASRSTVRESNRRPPGYEERVITTISGKCRFVIVCKNRKHAMPRQVWRF